MISVIERSLIGSTRSWQAIVSGFVEPVLYMLVFGTVIGELIEGTDLGFESGPTYQEFLSAGLIAASAMNGAVYSTTFTVFVRLRYSGLYSSMSSTPLRSVDIVAGEIAWSVIRGGVYSAGFGVALILMNLTTVAMVLAVVPVLLLTALAFACLCFAASTCVHRSQHLELLDLLLVPMFILGTTFFPVSLYPGPIQIVIESLPLYHGIDLVRSIWFGGDSAAMVISVLYLGLVSVVGFMFARKRLTRELSR